MTICKNCTLCAHPKSNYIKWLVNLLSPVIFGQKPSEIISIPKSNFESIEEIQAHFSACSKIKFKVIDFSQYSYKVFFFHPSKLESTLKNKSNLIFLSKLGYSSSFEKILCELFLKISFGNIPDEIGVFLGYPLKDVIGFIGHPSLPYVKTQAWRIYGNPRLSDQLYSQFVKSKEKMSFLLETQSIEDIFASYLQ
ncbi:MAG: DUF3793 family protein [Tissierellales bacterium]|jgi:hypothetical protein|nr:DUF3793 family protein [Tissierellales bacterium]